MNRRTDLTSFDGFEIAPVVQVDELPDGRPVYEQLADWIEGESTCDFWTVYGHYDPTDFNNGNADANVGVAALIDCHDKEAAETAALFLAELRNFQQAAKEGE